MAVQLQVRRGTTAQNDAFTGADGEISINTDNGGIRTHDGVTAGGTELARSNQIDSVLVKDVSASGTIALTAGEHGNSNHEYTGTITSNTTIVCPNTVHNFTAENLTSGAFTLTVKTAAGTGILIPQGTSLQLYNSSVNVEDANSGKLRVDTVLPITTGGTGQITAQAAIDALSGVAAATNEHVLTKDTASGNVLFKAIPYRIAVITGTFSMTLATGTFSVTGTGFTPKHVVAIGGISATAGCSSAGFSDGTTRACNYSNPTTTQNLFFERLGLLMTSAGNYQALDVSTFDADGVTLSNTKTGSPTGTATVMLLCFG